MPALRPTCSERPRPTGATLCLGVSDALPLAARQAKCIVAFVRSLHPLVCLPNQLIVKQGATARALCFISQGVLKITRDLARRDVSSALQRTARRPPPSRERRNASHARLRRRASALGASMRARAALRD